VPQSPLAEAVKDILSGVGITCLIFSISVYMPIFGFFFSLLIPLPTLIYRLKLGRKKGAVVPAAAILIMRIVLGGFSLDLLFFAGLMVLGFALGELIEAGLSMEKIILYACAAVLLSGGAGFFFYAQIAGRGAVDLASEYVTKNLELTLVLYKNMGISEDTIRMVSDSLPQIRYVLMRIIPALAVVSALFVSWTNLLGARALMRIRGLFYPDFGPLNLWRPPEVLVWGAIGCGFCLLLPTGFLKMPALNALIVLMAVYFFAGIAIVSYYFEKKRLPRILRFFFYSLIGLQQFVLLMVIGLGFFDVWLNFRKMELQLPKKDA
jgi:uncharacterized protein YybS (DUF2232 family)